MEPQGLILDYDDAARLSGQLKQVGATVVLTNGCFDLIHRGHVDYLRQARALGDFLFVGLNDDAMVRQLKGPGRPILDETDRAFMLAELRSVDAVVLFHEPTAERLVQLIKPDIYAKGGDWGPGQKTPPEVIVVEQQGGRVVYLPYVSGRSTSEILEQVRRGVGD
ncbi:MAG: adenylyltransferase/cytidyltransferase family protein [Chloroflexota bacterium]|nr:adenylyltransferase/cytidyltransferase family protein [Chloroflexota bacterium]